MTQLFDSVTMKVSDLIPHPRNYRTHPEDQVRHLMQSIKDHGFYRNVVVANDNTILAGHGVVEAASQMGMTEISVVKLDIDPFSTQALKVLTGDNYISSTAMDDDRMLSEILKEIRDDAATGSGEENLIGTGFDDMQLSNFLMVTRHKNEIADFDAAAEWAGAGAPEFDPGPQEQHVTVRFMGEEDREKFLEHLGLEDRHVSRKGSKVTFWWPPREKSNYEGVRVEPTEGDAEGEPTDAPAPSNDSLDGILEGLRRRQETTSTLRFRPVRPFLFVKVPRTGSQSMHFQFEAMVQDYVRITKAKVAAEFYAFDDPDFRLLSLSHNHESLTHLIRTCPNAGERIAERFTFGFVRNPWDRLVSVWKMQKHAGMKLADCPFEEYVSKLERDQKNLIYPPASKLHRTKTANQVRWLSWPWDRIGRFETIDKDFTSIMRDELGFPYVVAKLAKTVRQHKGEDPSPEWTKDLIARVGDLYVDDVLTLGYDGPGEHSHKTEDEIREAIGGRS